MLLEGIIGFTGGGGNANLMLRHANRANILVQDGHAESLTIGDLKSEKVLYQLMTDAGYDDAQCGYKSLQS